MSYKEPSGYQRILSVDPSRTGFGFVILEGGQRLVDWGVARLWSTSDQEFVARLETLTDRYGPALLVVEDLSESRRRGRAARRIELVKTYAASRGIRVVAVTRRIVRSVFAEAGTTKHEIAVALAVEFPELAGRVPPQRKLWMSEDERMSLFDALSFAVAALRATALDKRAA
jgi:hypothetical protein